MACFFLGRVYRQLGEMMLPLSFAMPTAPLDLMLQTIFSPQQSSLSPPIILTRTSSLSDLNFFRAKKIYKSTTTNFCPSETSSLRFYRLIVPSPPHSPLSILPNNPAESLKKKMKRQVKKGLQFTIMTTGANSIHLPGRSRAV